MLGLSERTMKRVILKTFCHELLGLDVSAPSTNIRLRRAFARTMVMFTEEDHEHLFVAVQLAYKHLAENKELDVYSFLCLCLGINNHYVVLRHRVPNDRYKRALRKSYEIFQDDQDMTKMINRISDMLDIFFDLELLSFS